jgi:hypothetical protein
VTIGAGRFSENITLDADALGVAGITLASANTSSSLRAHADLSTLDINSSSDVATVTGGLAFDTADGSRAVNETWIDGTVTVASDNVTLSGLRLHSYNGGLKFSGDDIDDFTLNNSYVTGFHGDQSVRYTGDGTNTGWTISGNMIGGVAGGTGGSLYLTDIDGATVADNVFFRPGAAHVYLTEVDNVTVSNNLFYHGVHADGANFDSKLSAFQAADDAGYGYVGFSGGDGYGYGFGYGFSSSSGEDISEMGSYGGYGGYGPTGYAPSGYGLDAYGGGGANQADYVYYGRNYIAEVKGTSDSVTFDGNWGLYNSGGIQFWDEASTSNVFTNITISDNQMNDFINADQDNMLSTVSSRHKSGLVGGVVFQVDEDSTSDGLTISGNKIYGDIGQVLNTNDLDALIEVGGSVDDVTIVDNVLDWSGSVTSGHNVTSNSGTIVTQGILLYGDVNEGFSSTGDYLILKDNTFNTDEPSGYSSSAIYLNDAEVSGIGTLTSDIYLIDTSGNTTYGAWEDDASVVGSGYDMDDDAGASTDGTVPLTEETAVSGTDYTVRTSADTGSDIIFSTSDTIA